MHLLLLIPFLLTACAVAPAQIVVTAGPVDYLAAGEIVRAATGTAIAQATANAQATAARGATVQAAEARQTDVALQATQAAGQAAATDAAAVRTQAAGQTAAWGTPTAAALGTALAFAQVERAGRATQISANAARAAASADAVGYVVQVVVAAALLTALAAGAVVVYWTNERQRIRSETCAALEAERVEQARAATQRALAEAVRASLVERDGAPYLVTPAGLVPMLPMVQLAVTQPNQGQAWRWRVAIARAVQAGLVLGEMAGTRPQFGERDLAGADSAWVVNPDGTPSSTGYRKINRVLRALEVWTTAGRDTTWAPGWGAERFERELDALPLPAWLEGEPPEVRIPGRSSAVSAVERSSAVPQFPEGV